MPDLIHTLQGHDLGFLKIVAEAWGIEMNAPDVHAALPVLSASLLNKTLVTEIVEALPPAARAALQALLENEGRMSWAMFSRRFGELRILGKARRDRERPDLAPTSPTEILWYRTLIGKAFFNLQPEPQEYAYIPEDFVEMLQSFRPKEFRQLGRPASPGETTIVLPASGRVLDHCCTLLAAIRNGRDISRLSWSEWKMQESFLIILLKSAGLVNLELLPQPEPTRKFLEAPRGTALALLVKAWLDSSDINELFLLPGLQFEGGWQNNPFQTRQTVLGFLELLPEGKWWNLSSFVASVREEQPDFQRPAGDYDLWFIRKQNSEEYLRGFSNWDEIDGALLRFFICGPMHWLGLFDLALPADGNVPAAFRPTNWAKALLEGKSPTGFPLEKELIHIHSDGRLILSPLTSRAVRYQVARFTEWDQESAGDYRYRVTPKSLDLARQQGLLPAHLIRLLKRAASPPIPPTFLQAIERWDKYGIQASLQNSLLLRVASPEILEALRKTRASRYLGEALSPTTILVRPGGEDAVNNALSELGFLTGFVIDKSSKI